MWTSIALPVNTAACPRVPRRCVCTCECESGRSVSVRDSWAKGWVQLERLRELAVQVEAAGLGPVPQPLIWLLHQRAPTRLQV